jgi:hypothetical protein
MGRYQDFVRQCREKIYPPDVCLYKHHIIPRYVAKKKPHLKKIIENPKNIIKVSYEDHKKLHQLRYEQYKNRAEGDKIAFLKMDGRTEEAWIEIRREGARATHRVLKQRGENFWNSEFQKEMAKRSLNSPKSREMRSRGGQKGGKKRQENRIIQPNEKFFFSYQGKETLCVFNCQTGSEVLKELNSCIPTPLTRVSPLLTGKRKSLYNWSCKKISMTISSEAEKGTVFKQKKTDGFLERSETST